MMDKRTYKKEVDSFCDDKFKLTAEDILKAASEKSQARVDDISGVTKKMKIKKLISIVAVCLVTVGAIGVVSAAAAGFGPLTSLFNISAMIQSQEDIRNAHEDAISASLAEQGYLMNISETQVVGDFEVTLEGITGDWSNLQMVYTIKCNDEEYVANHSRLNMTYYGGASEEQYANRIDLVDWESLDSLEGYFIYDTGYAVQSPDDPSVYILTCGVYPTFVEAGATICTEIRSIRETDDTYINYENEEVMLNCAFSFVLPEDMSSFADTSVISHSYEDAPIIMGTHDVEYHVTYVEFSEYSTYIEMEFYYDGTDLEYIDEDFWANYDAAGEAYQSTTCDMRLIVDGVEYEPTELGGVYGDPSGLRRGMIEFSEINFAEASSVALTYPGSVYVIKGEYDGVSATNVSNGTNTAANASVISHSYENAPIIMGTHNVEYHMTYVEFSEESTYIEAEFYYEGTDLEYIDEDFWGNYDAAGEAHQSTTSDMRLVVDGVEYEPIELGGVYGDPSGLRRGMVRFPAIDIENASSIALILDEQFYLILGEF